MLHGRRSPTAHPGKRKFGLGLASALVVGACAMSVGPSYAHSAKNPEDASTRSSAVNSLALGRETASRSELDATSTAPFSMVGAVWSERTPFKGEAQVRVRNASTGQWSGWLDLELDKTDVPRSPEHNGGSSGRTEPRWVGRSDGIQTRVTASGGRQVPDKMHIKLIDPGTMPSSDSDTPAPSTAPTKADAAVVAAPPMTIRTQWAANENLPEPPIYGSEAKAIVVHPTGGTNDYSCADSRALVKGIQAYHMADPDHMWNDIGFNFLVDKCGTIFEGRAGGIDRPVTGFHTPGFNTDTVGVGLLGEMDAGKPTAAALESLARLSAWKLTTYGHDPLGTTVMTATASNGKYEAGEQATLPSVAGAQDAMAASTPDTNLYSELPTVRSYAASAAANSAIPTADFNRDGVSDLVAGAPQAAVGSLKTAGAFVALPGSKTGPNDAAKRLITQDSAGVPGNAEAGDNFGADSAYGDLNGDGYADLVTGAPGEDDTSSHTDAGYVVALYGPGLDTGAGYNLDTADRVNGARLGDAVTVGDFNSDGKADIFSIAPGAPTSWWVYDSAAATTKSGRLLTSATGTVTHPDAATGDFNRDGYADVATTYLDPDGTGRVMLFKGSATGLQPNGVLSAKGGRSIAAGDMNGDGYTDIVVGQPYTAESQAFSGGQVTAFYGSVNGITATGASTVHQDSTGVPGAAEAGDAMGAAVSVGDYNLDGYADVLVGLPREDITRASVDQTDAGAALILLGSASGVTGTGSLALNQDTTDVPGDTEKADAFGSAVTLTDLRGTTRADLAIGADGENAGNGTILQIDTDTNGIIPAGAVYLSPGTLGLPTASHVGQALAP